MKKMIIIVLTLLFFIPTIAMANVTVYQHPSSSYTNPAGWTQLTSTGPETLYRPGGGDYFYYWAIRDNASIAAANIVFSNISNSEAGSSTVEVWLKDYASAAPFAGAPEVFSGANADPKGLGWVDLGTAFLPLGSNTIYDLAFSIADTTVLTNSTYFGFAIDPDCHFTVGNIAVNYNTVTQGKVPEPITLVLYGIGFAGAGLYRRMRRPE